ncbi:MAG: hypothetical protein KF773_27080 [Deltaproteobacteria bacterium]|nr:hypothetical protein [Deltaproteobacteria bacterium]
MASMFLIGVAHADAPCSWTVALDGDEAVAAEIRDHLKVRGISTDTSMCSGLRTHVERRGEVLVVTFAAPGGALLERVVSDSLTAAVVIESLVRVDVSSPLLARRAPTTPPAPTPAAQPVPLPPPPPERRGLHVFGSFDTALADDRTSWLGVQVGACVMLGAICPSARFRFDVVMAGGRAWDDSIFRNSSELLVGFDVPLSARTWLVVPGVAMGMGGVRTERADPDNPGGVVKRETTGMRGQLHATVLVPLSTKLAVDLSLAGVLLQETEIDEGRMTPLPRDPWVVFRFGVGLRYGDR